MRRSRIKSGIASLAFALVLVATALVAPTAPAQEGCSSTCREGNWNSTFWTCDSGSPHNCSHCDVVCPGGGGGWTPENP